MADLKPCPFCGRMPIVDDCEYNQFFVRCECGISQDKLYGQKCDAVRAWNRRKDAMPVIRCNDCIFSDVYSARDGRLLVYCCNHGCFGFTPNDYCSRGKKKTE